MCKCKLYSALGNKFYDISWPGIYKLRFSYHCDNKGMYRAFKRAGQELDPDVYFPEDKLMQGFSYSNYIKVFIVPKVLSRMRGKKVFILQGHNT